MKIAACAQASFDATVTLSSGLSYHLSCFFVQIHCFSLLDFPRSACDRRPTWGWGALGQGGGREISSASACSGVLDGCVLPDCPDCPCG